jgi:hypothetical protein
MTRQIVTYGTNESKLAYYGLNSRGIYPCANASITRGLTGEVKTLDECFNRFPSVRKIAEGLKFITGVCAGAPGQSGPPKYTYDLWTGATAPDSPILFPEESIPFHTYLNKESRECVKILGDPDLGESWLGCLWGTPALPFSCICPNVNENFHAYLKLRLNVATFWNTPKDNPVKRAAFLDALKYGRKMNITVAGDFNLKIGQVAEIVINAASGYPYGDAENSQLNGLYYIIGIKHVVSNSGTHESALSLTQIPPNIPQQEIEETEDQYTADYS